MATNSSLLHVSFFLFLIVSTAATAAVNGSGGGGDDEPMRGAPLIRHACEDTKYYDLCVSSLVSRPGSSKFLFKDLDKPVVAATIDSATETRRQINIMLRRRPSTKGSLGACSKFYNLAIYNLRLAEKYLNSYGFKETYEYGPVEGWTRAAQGYFDKCGATLKKQRGVGAPLKQRNEIARRLADNAFVIVGDLMV